MYSHRLGHAGRRGGASRDGDQQRQKKKNGEEGKGDADADLWLVGGASNVGCAVLRTEGFEVNMQHKPEVLDRADRLEAGGGPAVSKWSELRLTTALDNGLAWCRSSEAPALSCFP